MEKLKGSLRKNGVDYKLIQRNQKVALFELTIDNVEVGYEVAKLMIIPNYERFGKHYPERESLPGNELFGNENSKAFFPQDKARALEYFQELTYKLNIVKNGFRKNQIETIRYKMGKESILIALA